MLPELESDLYRDVGRAIGPVSHPGTQRVRGAGRKDGLVLPVGLAARTQVDFVWVGTRHHGKRLHVAPLQHRRHLDGTVQGPIRKEMPRVAAFRRRLGRVGVDHPSYRAFGGKRRQPERNHQQGGQDRLVDHHGAHHAIYPPERIERVAGLGRTLLDGILVAGKGDPPVVAEKYLDADDAQRARGGKRHREQA